ncbi:NYN domain-containing protein [Dolichospermum circinale CS-1225]|uniref:NYN domain-containing protein n=1 Tax=Dolichospermum circinale TaxID=109265 RepID=UPI00048307D1|nr:NYN domain-containing protein [Dolichospermum circinale]MDB9522164.1 NYN domain-containing protein [Dolichospermum circinale CS-1225]
MNSGYTEKVCDTLEKALSTPLNQVSFMSIHIFWDNSNIWLVGRGVCQQHEPGDESGFRVHFANLFDFVVNNRQVDYAFVGGSIPPNDSVWKRFDDLGIKVKTQERGQISGTEVAVDESIQLEMANQVLDVNPPGVIILLTGDGSGYNNGQGFIKQLERAHNHGWQIEVVSWDLGCNRFLKKFAEDKGVYRSLETVYDKVTFINNKRWALSQ